MKNLLFIDFTTFYGGGQKFILNFHTHSKSPGRNHFIVSSTKLFEALKTENKLLLALAIKTWLKDVNTINSFIKNNNIDCVILNGNRPIYGAAFIKANIKIAYRHTSHNAFSGLKKFLAPFFLNFSYLFCHYVVVLYYSATKEVWFNKSKIRVINNGIPVPQTKKGSREDFKFIEFVTITRLELPKGLEWLINTFKNIDAGEIRIRLKIAGVGPDSEYLKQLASGSKHPIVFLGFIDDVDKLLSTSDVFILPSKFESFPLSVIEAMAVSLPIVASDTGGIEEMVAHNSNGFLVRYGCEKELKHVLQSLAESRDLREVFGKKSCEIFKSRLTIQSNIQKIEEIINGQI
jgi:glycosyltransferase involved in cell wall biosynthesis